MTLVNDYNEILTIDDFVPVEDCRAAVKQIDSLINAGFCNEVNIDSGREDECIHLCIVGAEGTNMAHSMLKQFYARALPEYQTRFPVLRHRQLSILDCKAQRTHPAGGFHGWHYENFDGVTSDRILAYTLYLNDDFEGGETEFLYQNMRVKPVEARFSLFPCSFLHTHRGNPPMSGTKYILTGWVIDLDPFNRVR
tara:strand:- start:22 stop:606 length:585 start_codon:yes stop_codon:yes gene_type:complete